MAAPMTARPDEVATTHCHGTAPAVERSRCGSAVPSVSIPTSSANAVPVLSGAQLTISFMPMG